MLKDANVKSYH